MKDRKIVIGVVALLIAIVMGITGCGKNNNNINSIITLDINPSIEMEIKKGKVTRATALNEDANDFIEGLEGKSLKDSFDIIIKRAGEHSLVKHGAITIALGMENKDNKIEQILNEVCDSNKVHANIVVPTINEEAKTEAKNLGITAAKAVIIDELAKENNEVKVEDLVGKQITELTEMKKTGKYCDAGYTLVGNSCEKAIKEEKLEESKACPSGYEEVNNKCYLKTRSTKELSCDSGYELKNDKCVGTEKVNAKVTCSTGKYNSKTGKCETLTYVSDGDKTCKNQNMDPKDILVTSDKCSGGKWPHDDNTCEGADKYYPDGQGGWCYNPKGDYDAIVTCPSGQTEKDGKCYSVTTTDATYSCPNGTLNGNQCEIIKTKSPNKKLTCSSGSTLYQDEICIDKSKVVDYVVGKKCNKDARLENGSCVYYEVVKAKSNK